MSVLSVVLAHFAAAQPPPPSNDGESIALTAGIPYNSMSPRQPGEVSRYRFSATTGTDYLIRVDQNGLDFEVSVESPDGTKANYNSPLFRNEPEFVYIDDAMTGEYRIAVESSEPTRARGTHAISVSTFDGSLADPRSVSAWRAMTDGAAANQPGFRIASEAAIDAYSQAAENWRALGETRLEAQAVASLAVLYYWGTYDYSTAADQAAKAAELYELLNEQALFANTVLVQAYSTIEIPIDASYEAAQDAYSEALGLFDVSYGVFERLGRQYDLAHVANNIALTYYYRAKRSTGDYERAEQSWNEALNRFIALGEFSHALNVRQNLSLIDMEQGYAGSAVAQLESIRDELTATGSMQLLPSVLGNLGSAYRGAGQFDLALEAYTEGQKAAAATQDAWWIGYALRGLGRTYVATGELDHAGSYLIQARDVAETARHGRVHAAAVADLGDIAFRTGDFESALLNHEDALRMTHSDVDRALVQAYVVRDLVALNRYEEANRRANEFLSMPGMADVTRADLMLQLGRSFLGLGDPLQAAEHFDDAREIYRALGLDGQEADVLNGLALAARSGGDLEAAIEYGSESLQLLERLRYRLEAPELRAVFAATRRGFYETQIDSLMTLYAAASDSGGDLLAEALSISERSRARVMMDLLAENSIELNRAWPSEEIGRQRRLNEQLAALVSQRDGLLVERVDSDEEQSRRARLEALTGEIAATRNELTLLEIRMRGEGRGDGEAPLADPLGASEIQAVLDADSVLLQYALGAQRSFVWIVTNDAIRVVELPDGDTIEQASREAFDSLQAYAPGAANRIRLEQRLERLAELVLTPVADLLTDQRPRVFVALDGALQYIPFGVLPWRADGADARLFEAREVIGVPSVSVLSAIRSREHRITPSKTLAVFADPVFDDTDPRLAGAPAVRPVTAALRPEQQMLITRSSVADNLSRLPATGAEGRAIAELVPEDSRLLVTGPQATRENVLNANLDQYRFLHFATHGLVDSSYPHLSALALSRFDESSTPRNGFLRLADIYGLDLNADLVVLSACDTALGREVRGEGLLGLTQGFFSAGARTLIVSLWQVPDATTAALMTRLYEHMLRDGLRPAAALREAQLSLASERDHPYFWGAFVALGEG